jgi:hypothetical protein
VLNGRAAWLDEGRTLKMVPDITCSSSEKIKEESSMVDESVYPTNGEPEINTPALPEADGLLLYQAKQNVKDKKNLVRHIAAYIAAWPVLAVFYGGILQNMTHPSWWRASGIINNLNAILPIIPAKEQITINSAITFINSYFRHNYVPGIWYAILGAMAAWGAWIAVRVAKQAAKKSRAKFTRKGKPDPVIQEYNRLKNMASDEAM